MSSAKAQTGAGEVGTATVRFASVDGTSKPAAVTVTITGTNDAAVISTDAKAITESNVAQAVNGTLTVTDVDSATTFVEIGSASGRDGNFAITTAGAWT